MKHYAWLPLCRWALAAALALAAGRGAAQPLPTVPPGPRHEVRAVWLTTLWGLDWPEQQACTPEQARQQQEALCRRLDRLQAAGINTILFQTRIRATTAYPSAFEPWDPVFAGRPGQSPGYDPLAFAVAECHRRGLEIQAWVVAFPIGNTAAMRRLGKQALTRRRPELCRRAGDQWFMDPGVPGTADYLAALCKEIVTRYDVDGIHLDYIRYPEKGIPWNDNTTYRKYGKGMDRAAWRTQNVTRCVARIHEAIKAVRPWVKLSCSPVGKYADLPRQSSMGWNARDAVNQEAQEWLKRGIMDELFPMMYFDGVHFYPFAADWAEHAAGRIVAPGLGIYFLSPEQKDWDLDAVRRQLCFLRTVGAGGAAFFRERFLSDNVKGVYDLLAADFYRRPALQPPMTWADSIAPSAPRVRMVRQGHTLRLDWSPATDNTAGAPIRYRIYRCEADTFAPERDRLLAEVKDTTAFAVTPALPRLLYSRYAVTAVDAFGNESPAPQTVRLDADTAPPFATTDGRLAVPDSDLDTELLLVADAAGRTVLTLLRRDTIDVKALAPGAYELQALGRKGTRHRLLLFWKK